MEIVNGLIVDFDKNDKDLVIPKEVIGADYAVYNLMCVEGFDSITVEEGNEHFYMQAGCLIWRDKKALMLALQGAKIPDDGSVTTIAGGAFMYHDTLKEMEIPGRIREIRYSAFANTGLEKVTLNEGLKGLDAYAFGFNDNLQELAIPTSVRKIVTHDILEQVTMIAESGYRNKLYNVYKNRRAFMWARKYGLKIKLREEDKKK